MSPVALVTGASSGLGQGLALRLAREGWGVGLAARRQADLERMAAEIRSGGGEAVVLACDVGHREEVHRAVARCQEELGPIDLLVVNAGVSEMTLVEDLRADMVERILRVNFLGAVYPIEAVLPGMLDSSSGHIVGVSSLAGLRGLPKSGAYSASKGALRNFLESLRIDLRGTGVDVTVISPGYVRTPMTAQNDYPMPLLLERDDAVERMYQAIRLRRRSLMFPWPLARLVWVGQLFPDRLYDWLASRVRREKRGRSRLP